MARMNDNSPVGYTCNKIDKVIFFIENTVPNTIDSYEKQLFEVEKQQVIQMMEDLRSANDELRYWGNQQYNEREQQEELVSDLKCEIGDLKDEIKELESKLKNTETLINN